MKVQSVIEIRSTQNDLYRYCTILLESTVKNEYPKNIIDSTVVNLGQATTGCYDKYGLIK